MKSIKILKRVQEHYEYLISLGYDVICTCLQGSQNYGLDEYTEDYMSDVDTKSIVLPPLDDFVNATSPVSEVIVLENNEHAEIKDIRVMFDMFKKMNISYIELLYSNYIIFNPVWVDLIEPLFANADLISSYNRNQFLRCIAGMAMEKRKALCHPYPSIVDKIEKYGYDGKQLSHCARLYEFILKYTEGFPLEKCYRSQERELLMNYKKQLDVEGHPLSRENAIELCDTYCKLVKDVKDAAVTDEDEVNPGAKIFLRTLQAALIKEKLRRELINEED